MLYNTKIIHLQRVFHGIRFKVNNEDWLSVIDSLFLCPFAKGLNIKNQLCRSTPQSWKIQIYYSKNIILF